MNGFNSEPFPHCVVDGLFQSAMLTAASKEWPSTSWNGWYTYNSPLEKKRACPCWQWIPPAVAAVLMRLGTLPPQVRVNNILPDFTLHGGGMHDMQAGDFLSLHLDADRHPATGLERRVNAILFLNQDWSPSWGGCLELWDKDRKNPVVSIEPVFNRLVLMETSDVSYHGVTQPLRCPLSVQRKSLAMYWWGLPRKPSMRPRAKFVATADEPDNPGLEAIREIRCKQ